MLRTSQGSVRSQASSALPTKTPAAMDPKNSNATDANFAYRKNADSCEGFPGPSTGHSNDRAQCFERGGEEILDILVAVRE